MSSQPTKSRLTTGTLILVMGPGGAGKSNFINVAANNPKLAPVNKSTTSETVVRQFVLPDPRRPSHSLIFVDTPGFNQTNELDGAILKRITQWLKGSQTYGPGVSFGGIIYLHSINQEKVATEPWPVVHLSPQLKSRLLLMTSKWDKPIKDHSTSLKREDELKGGVWKAVLDGGAKICRFENTEQSAWEAINSLLDLTPIALDPRVVRKEFKKICNVIVRKPGIIARLFSFLFS